MLIENNKNGSINETTVQRYLNEDIFSCKKQITRIKIKCFKKI